MLRKRWNIENELLVMSENVLIFFVQTVTILEIGSIGYKIPGVSGGVFQ